LRPRETNFAPNQAIEDSDKQRHLNEIIVDEAAKSSKESAPEA